MQTRTRAFRAAFLASTMLLAFGCVEESESESDSDPGGTDSAASASSASGADGGTAAAEDCPERCAEKAESCGAPPELAAAQCQGVCALMPSEGELECLEDEDCATLEQAFLGSGDACGLGGGSASGGSASGGSSSGGSASGGNPDANIGDACECSGSNADFESCSGTGSSCGDLTCYVTFGEGICSQTCTADVDGDDCPAGVCTENIINGFTAGVWCVP